MHRYLTALVAAASGMAALGLPACTRFDEEVYNEPPSRISNTPGYMVGVQPGETLDSIAERYDVTVEALIQANHLQSPYALRPRQPLIIPPPAAYVVRAGDTVAGISALLGVDEVALASANGLQKPYHMKVNQILTVPGGIGGDMRPMKIAHGLTPGRGAGSAYTPGPGAAEPPRPKSAISAAPLAPPPGVAPAPFTSPEPAPASAPIPSPTPAVAPQAPAVASAPAALPPPTVLRQTPRPPPMTAPAAPAPEASAPLAPISKAPAPQTTAADAPTQVIPPAPAAPPAAAPKALAAVVPETPPATSGRPHFLEPVKGAVIQGFGPGAAGQTNDGINISAPAGTPVRAAETGTVIYTGNELAGFGNLVLVRHPGGWVTAYGHLDAVSVQRGAAVTKGQAIGTVGQSGSVSSPQLHFEIRQGSKPVDPAPYLIGGG